MTTLRISDDLRLPLAVAADSLAIIARKGRGKTYAASVLAEELLDHNIQIAVMDPMGAWWGLRSGADGNAGGYPVIIMGGDHADVPLEPTSGKVVADFVLEEGFSVVVDMSLFESRADEIRFATAFMDRLYRGKKRDTGTIHLFVDEASTFAPMRVSGDLAKMVGAAEAIARRGRLRGLGSSWIDQRSASLNWNVLSQAGGLLILGLTGKTDRKAMGEWVKAKGSEEQLEEMLSELPGLGVGGGYAWWPEQNIFQRVQVRRRKTFDSSASPDPGVETTAAPRKWRKVDLEAVTERMATTIERAKADDPNELRKQIAALKRELKERPAAEPKRIEVPVEVPVPLLQPDDVDRLQDVLRKVEKIGSEIIDETKTLMGAAASFSGHVDKVRQASDDTQRARPSVRRNHGSRPSPRAARSTSPRSAQPPMPADDIQIKAGARRILEALARYPSGELTRSQIGVMAKFKITGGTFLTYMSTLKRAGFIEESGGIVALTDAGYDFIGEVPTVPQTSEELLEMWRSALKAGARRMLDALVEQYPEAVSREELGELIEMEPTGGTFLTYLSTLRRNGLVEVTDFGGIAASETIANP